MPRCIAVTVATRAARTGLTETPAGPMSFAHTSCKKFRVRLARRTHVLHLIGRDAEQRRTARQRVNHRAAQVKGRCARHGDERCTDEPTAGRFSDCNGLTALLQQRAYCCAKRSERVHGIASSQSMIAAYTSCLKSLR